MTNAGAVQHFNPVTDGSKHSLDLVVLALCQGKLHCFLTCRKTSSRTYRLRIIGQHYAIQKSLDLHRCHLVDASQFVHFRYMMAR